MAQVKGGVATPLNFGRRKIAGKFLVGKFLFKMHNLKLKIPVLANSGQS